MINFRDHTPIVIDEFNGLWQRGDRDNTPIDHFAEANNIRYVGSNQFQTRNGIGISQSVGVPLSNIKRIYNYPTQTDNTLIVLTQDDDGVGHIYHVVSATVTYGPILSIDGMEDFAFLPYAGRGYISPFGLSGSYLNPPDSAPGAALNYVAGSVDNGLHSYAVTFVTAVGETTPSPLVAVTTKAATVDPSNAPVVTVVSSSSGNVLDVGETYRWAYTYVTTDGTETLPSPVSNAVSVISNSGYSIQFTASISAPSNVQYINIYRTTGDGAIYYREYSNIYISNIPMLVGVLTNDATLVTNPQAPTSNGTIAQQVNLSNIPIGDSSVISRKIYRTEADDDQLKLLTTLADNSTTVYADNIADSELGADAPSVNSALVDSTLVARGLQNEFLYVYAGDGTNARKAAGVPLSGTMTAAIGAAGHTDGGFHLFAFVAETISGYLTAPALITGLTTLSSNSVSFGNIPTSGSPYVTKRHLVATKKITGYNGNTTGYQFYFVPNATINNNTDTFLNNISFFDQDLIDDASYLLDNFSEIPAGAVLNLYHNRLCLFTTATDISAGYISAVGEPEAINQIDGLVVVPPDGNPITNAQELRDILYVTKRTRTVSFIDNGDEPATWAMVIIDNALGTSVHGIATVIDSGSASVDFLMICTFQGLSLFNGRYITPELSWKIEGLWQSIERTLFERIQILHDPIEKQIYIVIPDGRILVANYANGMDPKRIRWAIWDFWMYVNTIAVADINNIIIGSDLR